MSASVREIILDTETTGLDPRQGHRIVEVGCLELINHIPTGKTFHRHINPDREISDEAVAVHGLTLARLQSCPRFGEIVADFLDFIADSPLVIHNAEFDVGFINAELGLLGLPPLAPDRATCTVKLARRRFPGSPASLDSLCKRFSVDNSGRSLHGALLDAQLLADCYVELLGGRQHGLALAVETLSVGAILESAGARRVPRAHSASDAELLAHAAMISELKSAVWSGEA